MTETVEKTTTGAILYDQAIINQISEDLFTADAWLHSEILTADLRAAGRGNTFYVGNVPRQFVLRHYRRGGVIGKLVRDRYVWSGADKTRSFAEWRLLAKLAEHELRVPRPAAAYYCRRGTFYSADIITVRIPDVRSLFETILHTPRSPDFWSNVGVAIQEFHAAGVFHADMNAYNLQIDKRGQLWMLDFDKGRLLSPGRWQQQNLSRLHRSLQKIRLLEPRLHFKPTDWEALLAGYFEAQQSVSLK